MSNYQSYVPRKQRLWLLRGRKFWEITSCLLDPGCTGMKLKPKFSDSHMYLASLFLLRIVQASNRSFCPAGLEEAQAAIKIAGRSINNLRYADDTTLTAESKEELKSLLMKVKEKSEKANLELGIQKTKIMASSPITSRQTDREKMETVTDYIFLGSKITAVGDCSHEIKPCSLGRKL